MATVKKTKKAQYGHSTSMDSKGRYNVVTKSNTPEGPRYYQYAHPNENTARARNNMFARANSADSIPAAKVNPLDIKALKDQKNGGKTTKAKAKDGKWIQKAINPKHKGYCTPMTKATCTPKRKALAMTLKKMAKARKGK
jgi:hypothetical protein